MKDAGNIYFIGEHHGKLANIYCSKFTHRNYQNAELLPEIVNTSVALDSYILKNESEL
jgi:hypothetical protein